MSNAKSTANLPRAGGPRPGAGKRKGRPAGGADAELASLAKALAHPARVRILRHLLRTAECLCGELCERLPLAQSTVSQHLKILKSAGLIQGTISRPRVCYCANLERLEELCRLLDGLCGSGTAKGGPPGEAPARTDEC